MLQECSIRLCSFTGHSIQLKGQSEADVIHEGRRLKLKFLVAIKAKMNIMGRDWIKVLGITQSRCNGIHVNSLSSTVDQSVSRLDELSTQYQDIFKDELGLCKIKAHLHVKNNVIPTFCKPRSLPFAYRQAVEDDLDRLVKLKVLEPISVSKWAAPVVIVPKPGGKVRICADLSTGVNQALDINQYPLPKPNDLFVALNGGSQFSKIDFSEAYLQVELDTESTHMNDCGEIVA